ncbi:VOC family protein [Sphaerimonospora mesophila]|uniref:VOC family protein n=1 Tax=Sphaerimonospora mesophila TaxID=37483 RepID=UPI0007C83197
MPRLDGATHINLTVTDLDISAEWYGRVFEMVQVNDVTPPGSGFRFRTLVHPASFASVVLGRPEEGAAGGTFDERRIGLHHFAYHVPERADLDLWADHLDAVGVGHSGITTSAHEAGSQIWLRDPDDIWLELYWVNRDFFAGRLREQWRAARRAGARHPFLPTPLARDLANSRRSPS